MLTLYAFRSVPPFARGLVRDIRVRWALEEAGLPYEERLIGPADQSSPAYRALQPFGQVPAIEMDGITLFESGAIVLEIAERSALLLPADAAGRARARAWLFAALNTVEPPVQGLAIQDAFYGREAWAQRAGRSRWKRSRSASLRSRAGSAAATISRSASPPAISS